MPGDPARVQDRYRGCLLGLAVGDALGTTLKFKRSGTFTPIDNMVGGGHFSLQPGQWTDNTSMALCLAESLLACGGFDAHDKMRLYRFCDGQASRRFRRPHLPMLERTRKSRRLIAAFSHVGTAGGRIPDRSSG